MAARSGRTNRMTLWQRAELWLLNLAERRIIPLLRVARCATSFARTSIASRRACPRAFTIMVSARNAMIRMGASLRDAAAIWGS